MKHLFRWEAYGFRVVQRLTRPQQALQAILLEKPDVVFADIRMPGMSGLELIDRARENGSECEFLIVSGYADFNMHRKPSERACENIYSSQSI